MTDRDEVKRFIRDGDRADLRKWLASCSDDALLKNWVLLSCCRVQDFSLLTQLEMVRRKMVTPAF